MAIAHATTSVTAVAPPMSPLASATDLIMLKSNLIALLRSHSVQRIHFVAEGVKISGETYGKLADLLSAGKIAVVVNTGFTALKKGGSYDVDDNTLTLRQTELETVKDKGIAVHELTHAAIDFMNLRPSIGLHRTENEGMAYIAERVYGLRSRVYPVLRHWPRIFHVADVIAQKIIATEPRLYHVSPEEMRMMRNAVGQNLHYFSHRGEAAPSNGIR
jgi:hypothetical protein